MPGFDGTGPRGAGPMTGRGFGRCRPVPQTDVQQTAETTGAAPVQQDIPVQQNTVYGVGQGGVPRGAVYGVGRGGIPRGCGMGFCGGRRRRCW
ncbi:MAG TPA: hypothetical protein ENN52_02245 [Methanofollis liminatans]|uniref:DUF5320 domain-containing protein n=1 Tax=Methanofollis liminatans TaxID=2201 RepID=A0A831LPK7_9EURY|nr:hypothetical protein [Methanofollis liminatans]